MFETAATQRIYFGCIVLCVTATGERHFLASCYCLKWTAHTLRWRWTFKYSFSCWRLRFQVISCLNVTFTSAWIQPVSPPGETVAHLHTWPTWPQPFGPLRRKVDANFLTNTKFLSTPHSSTTILYTSTQRGTFFFCTRTELHARANRYAIDQSIDHN